LTSEISQKLKKQRRPLSDPSSLKAQGIQAGNRRTSKVFKIPHSASDCQSLGGKCAVPTYPQLHLQIGRTPVATPHFLQPHCRQSVYTDHHLRHPLVPTPLLLHRRAYVEERPFRTA
jgi:hypothetical protein